MLCFICAGCEFSIYLDGLDTFDRLHVVLNAFILFYSDLLKPVNTFVHLRCIELRHACKLSLIYSIFVYSLFNWPNSRILGLFWWIVVRYNRYYVTFSYVYDV